MTQGRPHEEERKRILRQIRWAFVYAPPLFAVLVAAFAGLAIATFVPFGSFGFLGRWGLATLGMLAVPTLAYVGVAYLKDLRK